MVGYDRPFNDTFISFKFQRIKHIELIEGKRMLEQIS